MTGRSDAVELATGGGATAEPLRVGLIGWGVIGRAVGAGLQAGTVPAARLVAISSRREIADRPMPQVDVATLAATSDVIVEAASQEVVAESGPAVLAAGTDLLIASVGALADPRLRQRLAAGGPGRYYLTTGALGGLDALAAARRLGPFDRVSLTSTKPAANLTRPWMDDELVEQLERGTAGLTCFEGLPAEAATRFPQSINIAATLAEVVRDWELVDVVVRSGPPGSPNRHVIEAEGPAGHHRFEIANAPSPENPRSSWVVASAMLRSLSLLRPTTGAIL